MATPTTVQYRETSIKAEPRRFDTTNLLLFFVSLVVTVVMLIVLPQFFWVGLPFVCTFIVRAFDAL